MVYTIYSKSQYSYVTGSKNFIVHNQNSPFVCLMPVMGYFLNI